MTYEEDLADYEAAKAAAYRAAMDKVEADLEDKYYADLVK